MAWHEQGPSGNYFVCLRIGSKRFRRSLKTDCKDRVSQQRRRDEVHVSAPVSKSRLYSSRFQGIAM
jgi:hypothetical protein